MITITCCFLVLYFCTLLIDLFEAKLACYEKTILDLTSECFVILKFSQNFDKDQEWCLVKLRKLCSSIY